MRSINDWTVLNPGDIVYESTSFGSLRVEVLTKPCLFRSVSDDRTVWTFAGRVRGKIITLLKTEGDEHYGPRLYDSPEMLPVLED